MEHLKQPPRLRVGVVGAGIMGANHLRVYNTLKGVDLVAIVDADKARAKSQAALYGCQAFERTEDLIGKVDAVSIAAPSVHHAAIGTLLLESGIHCLIEKPLATTEEDCLALIAAAERAGVVLLAGHIERFNPVVQQLTEILSDGHHVHAVDVRRMSSTGSRINDVDVVADLMVHDLDIVLSLVNARVSDIAARGVHTLGAKGEDYVSVLLSFANGSIASLTASRITQNTVRSLNITTDASYITADYSTQELMIHRQGSVRNPDQGPTSQANYILDLTMERVLVRNAEPLMLELRHFIEAVSLGVPPQVSGAQALDALRLVWQIQEQIGHGIRDD